MIPSASVSVDNLIVNVDGGDPASNNALVVGSTFAGVGGGAMPALPANEFAVVSRSATPNSGTVRVFANGSTQFPDINYQNVATVAPQVYVAGPNGLNPNLLVMGPDLNEPNDFQGTATFLGSGATLQVQNATIFPAGSEYPGARRTRTITRSWPRRPARSISKSTSTSTPGCCPAMAPWTSKLSTPPAT